MAVDQDNKGKEILIKVGQEHEYDLHWHKFFITFRCVYCVKEQQAHAKQHKQNPNRNFCHTYWIAAIAYNHSIHFESVEIVHMSIMPVKKSVNGGKSFQNSKIFRGMCIKCLMKIKEP